MATQVMPLKRIQPVPAFAADRAGLSAFHMHRMFSSAAGEAPKQFTLRLRLDRAALLLPTGEQSVLNVALSCGFQSHEAFCRAFRRRFGMRPGVYRARGFAASVSGAQEAEHAALVTRPGPILATLRETRTCGDSRVSCARTNAAVAACPSKYDLAK